MHVGDQPPMLCPREGMALVVCGDKRRLLTAFGNEAERLGVIGWLLL
jgi:hypothetical protein